MAGSTLQFLPEEILTSKNGHKIEFAIQRFLVNDVQLRPRIEAHERTNYHKKKIYHRGESAYVDFTTTDTSFSTHEDTRILLVYISNGEELVVDLQNVGGGYFRGDQVVLAMWRIAGEKSWTFGFMRNQTRGSWYRWWLGRGRLRAISGRGVFPEVPLLVKLGVFFFFILPSAAEIMKALVRPFTLSVNVPFISWTLAFFITWFAMAKVMRWAERRWNAPIDQAIAEIGERVGRAANNPPLSDADAAGIQATDHYVNPKELKEFFESAAKAGASLKRRWDANRKN